MGIRKDRFGKNAEGKTVDLYTLTNTRGMEALITNYGAAVVSLKVPDQYGKPVDVTLGYNSLEGYLQGSYYFGSIVGHYANRIAGGKFPLQGKEYTLTKNEGDDHLHGGTRGFDKIIWHVENFPDSDDQVFTLKYLSQHGEEG
jgi:aldose 1-epimerase